MGRWSQQQDKKESLGLGDGQGISNRKGKPYGPLGYPTGLFVHIHELPLLSRINSKTKTFLHL